MKLESGDFRISGHSARVVDVDGVFYQMKENKGCRPQNYFHRLKKEKASSWKL